jgi:hypothetical protein
LYQVLLGPLAPLIEHKHVLIAPAGALASLPFQVLVATKPVEALPHSLEGYQAAAWLGLRYAITVLPAVSSLPALRGLPRQERASEAFMGFGDPNLSDCDSVQVPSTCPGSAPANMTRAGMVPRRGMRNPAGRLQTERTDLARLKEEACRLPDTAFELMCVARSLGVGENAIRIGAAATESEVKRLSRTRHNNHSSSSASADLTLQRFRRVAGDLRGEDDCAQKVRGSLLATLQRYSWPPTVSKAARISTLTSAVILLGEPLGQPPLSRLGFLPSDSFEFFYRPYLPWRFLVDERPRLAAWSGERGVMCQSSNLGNPCGATHVQRR